MNVLVVFYSHSGNTRFIGEALAESLKADTFNLKLGKERYPYELITFVRGGAEALMKFKPKLDQIPEMNCYDAVVIGTPVWARTICPPIRSFLDIYGKQFRNKKTALFCTCAGNEGKTLLIMKNYLSLSTVVSEKRFCFSPNFDEFSIMDELSNWSCNLNSYFGGEK
jgi:flavodoxin